MKRSLHNHKDPYIALLNFRNTPQEGVAYTPVQCLMGRNTKTLIPTNPSLLNLSKINYDAVTQQRDKKQNEMSQKYIYRQSLSPLQTNEIVRMQPIDGTEECKEATDNSNNSNKFRIIRGLISSKTTVVSNTAETDNTYARSQATHNKDHPPEDYTISWWISHKLNLNSNE